MRQQVERDLVGVLLGMRLFALEQVSRLLIQLGHCCRARSGDGLVGGGDDPSDRAGLPQCVQRHRKGRRGAVGNGEDASVRVNVAGVHFRHDERDFRVHAPDAAIVYDDAALLLRSGGHLPADVVVGGDEGDVGLGEDPGRRLLDNDLPAIEG